MMSSETQILLGLAGMSVIGYSWYVHFKVRDGLGRLMFLWGCGMLFLMLFARTIGYILLDMGVIFLEQSQTWNQINFFWIYAIIIGQFIIQNNKRS
jgi:hypothetical protein